MRDEIIETAKRLAEVAYERIDSFKNETCVIFTGSWAAQISAAGRENSVELLISFGKDEDGISDYEAFEGIRVINNH